MEAQTHRLEAAEAKALHRRQQQEHWHVDGAELHVAAGLDPVLSLNQAFSTLPPRMHALIESSLFPISSPSASSSSDLAH